MEETKVEIWKDYKIRFVQVNGKWWAVASDITRAMGFSDSHTALRKMPSKYKGRYKVPTLANKAISTKYGYPKIVKKEKMSHQMLKEREGVLDDTVELMNMNDKYNLGLHVSKKIYKSMQQK